MNQVISYPSYKQSHTTMVTNELYSRKNSRTSINQHDLSCMGKSKLESIRLQIQKRLVAEKDRKLTHLLQQQHQQQLLHNRVMLKPLNVYKNIESVRAFFAEKRAKQSKFNQGKTLVAISSHDMDIDRDTTNQDLLISNIKNKIEKLSNSRSNLRKNIVNNNERNLVNNSQQHQFKDTTNRSNPLPPIQTDRNKHDNSRKRRYRRNNNKKIAVDENQQPSFKSNKYPVIAQSDHSDDELEDLKLGHIKNIRRKKLKKEIIRRLSSRQLIQQDSSNVSMDSGGESTYQNMVVDDINSGRNSSNLQFSTRPEAIPVTSLEIDNNKIKNQDHIDSPQPTEKSQPIRQHKHSKTKNVFDNAVKAVDKASEVDRDSILDRQSKASLAIVSYNENESRQQTPESKLEIQHITTAKAKNTATSKLQQDSQSGLDQSGPVVLSSYRLPDNIDHQTNSIALVSCQICGRKFAADRLEKHQNICQKASNKKRTVFDTSKHRIQGTENEQYVSKIKNQPQPKPKKTNWRAKHNDFIQAIRAAKAMEAHLANGGKISDLPPPPPSENPDYVQCPHCQRKFNQTAAERHIPKCKDIKNRPAPFKRTIKR